MPAAARTWYVLSSSLGCRAAALPGQLTGRVILSVWNCADIFRLICIYLSAVPPWDSIHSDPETDALAPEQGEGGHR